MRLNLETSKLRKLEIRKIVKKKGSKWPYLAQCKTTSRCFQGNLIYFDLMHQNHIVSYGISVPYKNRPPPYQDLHPLHPRPAFPLVTAILR